MPDHFHLLVESASAEALSSAMAIEMSALARAGLWEGGLWQSAPPVVVPDLLHLKRHIRYIHLNPCRAGLAADPLEWEWSTHRDAVGAVATSWLDRGVLGRAFGGAPAELAKRVHSYVSADPAVRVDGTSLPVRLPASEVVGALSGVEWAVLQATRAESGRRRDARRLKALAAESMGMSDRARLAEWLGVSTRTVRRVLSTPITGAEDSALRATRWVLSAPHRFAPRGEPAWRMPTNVAAKRT